MAWLILLNILHIYKYKRLVNSLKISQSSFTLRDQSDQMARLFVQYLDIYQNTKLPNSIKIGQIRFKGLPNSKKPQKIAKDGQKFAKSCHTVGNRHNKISQKQNEQI